MHFQKYSSIENTVPSCTQSIQPALGFTLAEVHRAESNPTLTVPQLLEIEPCREYTETPLKMLDGLYVTQPKRFLPLVQEAKKLVKELCKEEIASQWAYTNVMQMLTHLIKNSFHDKQLILINTARVLKFLESYAS